MLRAMKHNSFRGQNITEISKTRKLALQPPRNAIVHLERGGTKFDFGAMQRLLTLGTQQYACDASVLAVTSETPRVTVKLTFHILLIGVRIVSVARQHPNSVERLRG